MPTDDKMSIDEQFKWLPVVHERYAVADSRGRGQALDEMAA